MPQLLAAKLARVREYLQREALDAVVVSRIDNLFWLCRADTHVGLNSEAGVAALVVTAEAATLVTSNIEAPRLQQEEFAVFGLPLVSFPWFEGSTEAALAPLLAGCGAVGSDTPAPGRQLVNLAPLRYRLFEPELTAYRALGHEVGAAVGQVARELQRGETEFAVAGRLSAALLTREVTPVVLLVAADQRLRAYRHPIPTAQRIDERVMLVAVGRRQGLTVAVTRLVSFGPLSDDLRRRHAAVTAVDAAFIAATVPGAPVASVFAAGVAAYGAQGYPDEWQLHHQGGATGYAGRDYRATFQSTEVVQPGQAFAWNPSIAGTKSEDTILALESGPEVISASPDWPLLPAEAGGVRTARPDWLVR
ncbi:MAG: M24 family metallopeptidase [Fimbriimonadaceae bacterium]|nr:M24 family metallopeptidase [Fimbriimonadaceae bacterium]